ncbi:lipid A biosynthesis acyltransferase [Rhodoferax sp. GW822-FHT02A01]|uniref:lysophospholipid acyltransferase family protein n=1 Tax=Rhodoferax sp. GW822-FHT02A01 TaxID=3141537 RepID=UPI00315C82BB
MARARPPHHIGLLLMRVMAPLPLSWIRALGALLGGLLYGLVVKRRKVVLANLALCFPEVSVQQRERWARQSFIYFAQSWLDRAWLWHAKPETVRRRLHLVGAVEALHGTEPTVVFAPHFYGLDAAGTALNLILARPMVSIYTPQRNQAVDHWLHVGRRRFGQLQLFYRDHGVKAVVSALRAGSLLYLLPDMNFGLKESIFVPFFGVPAATVPSLSRFARLGLAQVVPVTARMTRTGYEIEVHRAWADYPSSDVEADTTYMNHWLEQVIRSMPDQYYWVHKRFKDRPPGALPVY